MLQLAGPMQDAEGKSIDFLPIWLRVDPGATFIFIPQIQGGRSRKVSHLFCQSP